LEVAGVGAAGGTEKSVILSEANRFALANPCKVLTRPKSRRSMMPVNRIHAFWLANPSRFDRLGGAEASGRLRVFRKSLVIRRTKGVSVAKAESNQSDFLFALVLLCSCSARTLLPSQPGDDSCT
jgi:hypothetical protein